MNDCTTERRCTDRESQDGRNALQGKLRMQRNPEECVEQGGKLSAGITMSLTQLRGDKHIANRLIHLAKRMKSLEARRDHFDKPIWDSLGSRHYLPYAPSPTAYVEFRASDMRRKRSRSTVPFACWLEAVVLRILRLKP